MNSVAGNTNTPIDLKEISHFSSIDNCDEIIQNILICLLERKHINSSSSKMMLVSKKFLQMITNFHPILQVIEKVRKDHPLLSGNSNDIYVYPSNWKWDLNDTTCLLQIGLCEKFCRKLDDEIENLMKEEQISAEKKKVTLDSAWIEFIKPLQTPCKYKEALDQHIDSLAEHMEGSYSFHKALIESAFKLIEGYFKKKLITKDEYENDCKFIEKYDPQGDGRDFCLENLWSMLITGHKEIGDKINFNLLEELKEATEPYGEGIGHRAFECEDPLLMNQLFTHLKPVQKLQLLGQSKSEWDSELGTKALFAAIFEYDEWVNAIKVDPCQSGNFSPKGCSHIYSYRSSRDYIDSCREFYGIMWNGDNNDECNFFSVPEFFVLSKLPLQRIRDNLSIREAKQITEKFLDIIRDCAKKTLFLESEKEFKNTEEIEEYIMQIRMIRDFILKTEVVLT